MNLHPIQEAEAFSHPYRASNNSASLQTVVVGVACSALLVYGASLLMNDEDLVFLRGMCKILKSEPVISACFC